MDWLDRMNGAIDYIENNLTGEIDYVKAAKIACCSSFHFQRIFSFTTDMSLGEYIRNRRMTLAALELQNTSNKVIDIALNYGYNSPTAFTRTFLSVHGITPRSAKDQGVKLKSFPRITFQISIKGGKEMNYKIEEKSGFRLVGKKETVSTINGQNFLRIPQIWDEACQSGLFDSICELSNGNPSGVMGVCAKFGDNEFDYYLACSCDENVPKNMEELIIPEGLWVIFECVGVLPAAQQNVWKRIFTEWFPSSGYEHADAPEIEWYSDGDGSSDDYISEIWIPIIKK